MTYTVLKRLILTGAATAALVACAPQQQVHAPDPFQSYPLGRVYDCAANAVPDMRLNTENTPSPSFGCANQSNITLMVVDPRDLETPRPMTPPDARRRQSVIEAYRAGEDTATQAETQGTESLIEQ